jgi:hypothetical protein
MMEAIIGFLRSTKDARIAPAIRGKLAIKPQSRGSNIACIDEVKLYSLHRFDGEHCV